jgi:hypothetical protein
MSFGKRYVCVALAGLWFAALAQTAAEAATVTRGPYLQEGTPNSVIIRWRTDVATDSRVSYGSAPGALVSVVDNPSLRTEHELTVSGLFPDTIYYYAVGTSTAILAGDDANHFFLTAPVAGLAKPTRIWVLGDSGTANGNARAVRNAYEAFSGSRHTDLWLMLGDNAYGSGTDSEYQSAVFDMYPQMLRKSVLWPTLGNHDGISANSSTQSGPYYDIFTLPKNAEAGGIASGTEAYYSFDYGNMHFIVLDSFETDRSPTGAMLTWLQADLLATTQDWIMAFWHHPPYSKGSHDSDTESELKEMRENVLPLLEQGGVDLVLAGHSHSYERSFLLDGHYGTSNTLVPSMILNGGDGRPAGEGAYKKPTLGPSVHKGAVYTVAGSSGQTSGGPLNHPVMFLSLNVLGSLVLDVDGNRLDAVFLDSTGAVRDTFTILKGEVPNNPPAVRDDSAATNEDAAVSIPVLGNDTDPDGDPLTVASVTQPSHGTVTINGGQTVTYTPHANFNGSDSFTYTASDSRGGKSSATVTVAVGPVNDPPVANNQSKMTRLDTPVAITLVATDADGNPLTYSVVTPSGNGSLSGTAPNLTYTPGSGFSGSDSFTFKANDGIVDSNTATVSIAVTSPPADTGLQSPAANAPVTRSAGDKNGFESNPANAHANDDLFAVDTNSGTGTSSSCTNNKKDKHRFYNYNFSIPAASTIKGIEVRLDAKVDSTSGSPKLCVQLSWDGGATWTTVKSTPGLTTSEATYLLGSASDLWGRTWAVGNFSNTSFSVRVISVAGSPSRDFSLDWVAVRVTYQQ